MNDVLLISTNALINAYETESLKELEIGKEEIIDTHYISNLHKIEMLGIGLKLGNGLKILKTTEKVFEDEREIKNQKASSYSDCNLDISKNINELQTNEYKMNIDSLDPVEDKINDTFKVINNKTNEFLNDLVKEYKEIDDYLRDCLNCKPNFNPNFEEINFEFAFNFADFLNQWKNLLKDIKASLDPTKAFESLCDLFDIVSKQIICISSWPLILMAFPVLIGDIQSQMLDIRFSIWSGLGFIINPILSIGANIVEYLKNLFLPVLDCLDRGLVIIKNIISSVDTFTTSVVRQAYTVGDTFTTLKNIKVGLPVNKGMTLDLFLKRPSIEFSLPFVGNFSLGETGASIYSQQEESKPEENKVIQSLYNNVDILHQLIIKAKTITSETFDNILYTFKALSRYLNEPLKANFKLLGELKVLFNLFSVVQLIIALVNNGMSSCEDIKDGKAKFSSILPDYFKDIQLFAESPTEEELVIVDNFNSNNKRSIKMKSCGDIFANVNVNEKNLDSIYDIIQLNNR